MTSFFTRGTPCRLEAIVPRILSSTTPARTLNNAAPRLSRREALGLVGALPWLVPTPWQAPPAAATSLFDGKSLGAWKPVSFGGEGECRHRQWCDSPRARQRPHGRRLDRQGTGAELPRADGSDARGRIGFLLRGDGARRRQPLHVRRGRLGRHGGGVLEPRRPRCLGERDESRGDLRRPPLVPGGRGRHSDAHQGTHRRRRRRRSRADRGAKSTCASRWCRAGRSVLRVGAPSATSATSRSKSAHDTWSRRRPSTATDVALDARRADYGVEEASLPGS